MDTGFSPVVQLVSGYLHPVGCCCLLNLLFPNWTEAHFHLLLLFCICERCEVCSGAVGFRPGQRSYELEMWLNNWSGDTESWRLMLPRRPVWAAAAAQPSPAPMQNSSLRPVHRHRPWLHLQQQLMQISRPSYADGELVISMCLSGGVNFRMRMSRATSTPPVSDFRCSWSSDVDMFPFFGQQHVPPLQRSDSHLWWVFLQQRAGDSQSSRKICLDPFASAFPARKRSEFSSQLCRHSLELLKSQPWFIAHAVSCGCWNICCYGFHSGNAKQNQYEAPNVIGLQAIMQVWCCWGFVDDNGTFCQHTREY